MANRNLASGARGPNQDRSELLGPGRTGAANPAYNNSPTYSDDPRAEIDQVHLQINKTTDNSLQSTRNMVRLLEESQDAGVKTLENLHRQGEQLDRVEDNFDQMNQDMREAERNMNQMEKCCGLCILPWKRSKAVKASTKYEKAWSTADKKTDQSVTAQPRETNVKEGQGSSGVFIQRVTNDAREDEMENNLSEVSAIVGNLHHMAVDMERELSKQNKQIDKMIEKGDVLDSRVSDATRRTNVLLVK